MYISTNPLPGHLHTSASFMEFRKGYTKGGYKVPSSINEVPLQLRYYTDRAVFWRENLNDLYIFKLPPSEIERISWWSNEDGVIVDMNNGFAPVEVEPVSDLELLFLYR